MEPGAGDTFRRKLLLELTEFEFLKKPANLAIYIKGGDGDQNPDCGQDNHDTDYNNTDSGDNNSRGSSTDGSEGDSNSSSNKSNSYNSYLDYNNSDSDSSDDEDDINITVGSQGFISYGVKK